MKNIFCIECVERKDNKSIFIANVSCTFYVCSVAFASLESAKLFLEIITEKLFRRFNIKFTEDEEYKTPGNLINAYANDDSALIFDSVEHYEEHFRRR